jgi:hypothetical protein
MQSEQVSLRGRFLTFTFDRLSMLWTKGKMATCSSCYYLAPGSQRSVGIYRISCLAFRILRRTTVTSVYFDGKQTGVRVYGMRSCDPSFVDSLRSWHARHPPNLAHPHGSRRPIPPWAAPNLLENVDNGHLPSSPVPTQLDGGYHEEILLQGMEHGFKVEVGSAEPTVKALLNL